LVTEFMRGIYNLKPSCPRYAKIWDPSIVLAILKKWSPAKKLNLDHMEKLPNVVKFGTFRTNKQSRMGYNDPIVTLKAYPVDRRMRVFTYLSEYLDRTKKFRISCKKFLTYCRPIHEASKDTLTRWAKSGLKQAGVDTQKFASHSYRAASSSAAHSEGHLKRKS